MSTTTIYNVTRAEIDAAHDEWGCNCGPSALAVALRLPINAVRHAIPGFEAKHYTSPTMMKAGLESLRRGYVARQVPPYTPGKAVDRSGMFFDSPSVVRVQWTGPWTKPGANPKWAYWYTHWVATWRERGVPVVFDCNCGMREVRSWIDEIIPLLTETHPRADGGWFPTHIWSITPAGRAAVAEAKGGKA